MASVTPGCISVACSMAFLSSEQAATPGGWSTSTVGAIELRGAAVGGAAGSPPQPASRTTATTADSDRHIAKG
jgi:hypothetical protein